MDDVMMIFNVYIMFNECCIDLVLVITSGIYTILVIVYIYYIGTFVWYFR